MELEFKGSQGEWSVGKGHTVVTNDGTGFGMETGHSDVEYYGGFLIGESIIKEEDRKLIAAAPDLLSACVEFLKRVEKGEVRSTKSYNRFKEVVEKALL